MHLYEPNVQRKLTIHSLPMREFLSQEQLDEAIVALMKLQALLYASSFPSGCADNAHASGALEALLHDLEQGVIPVRLA